MCRDPRWGIKAIAKTPTHHILCLTLYMRCLILPQRLYSLTCRGGNWGLGQGANLPVSPSHSMLIRLWNTYPQVSGAQDLNHILWRSGALRNKWACCKSKIQDLLKSQGIPSAKLGNTKFVFRHMATSTHPTHFKASGVAPFALDIQFLGGKDL